jgi:hypothetical protein
VIAGDSAPNDQEPQRALCASKAKGYLQAMGAATIAQALSRCMPQSTFILLPAAARGNACKGRLCSAAGPAMLCSSTQEAPNMDDTPPRQVQEAR